MDQVPQLLQTVLDARDCRELAEFYCALFGLHYRDGDEPPADPATDDADWLVLLDDRGRRLAFQQTPDARASTWPSDQVPMQLHLDCTVTSIDELERHRRRAEQLGATLLLDRSDDADEPLYVMADPAGHPFCLFVS